LGAFFLTATNKNTLDLNEAQARYILIDLALIKAGGISAITRWYSVKFRLMATMPLLQESWERT